jgi:hypothetical protein
MLLLARVRFQIVKELLRQSRLVHLSTAERPMVFKGWAPGEAVGLRSQAACPALRQLLVQPGNMLVAELSSGAVKQAFYSPLATTIACNISTTRDNRQGVAFHETA